MAYLATIVGLALLTTLWWVAMPLRAVLHDRKLRPLPALDTQPPGGWPRVSVLVPARNEADGIEAAIQSLLEVDYPELEIVLIDDRSSDRTVEIVDRLARRDPRVVALHVESLPDGWLGKVHALQRGLENSRGDWLLFTDADVHFSPLVVRQAIAYCEHRGRDFIALLPDFINVRLLIGAAQAAFGILFLSMFDFTRVADPDDDAAMGIGAFNLLRREFVDPDRGLAWLRMELVDDAGLGLLAKRRGARCEILSGNTLIRVDWYPTLRAMLDGVMQRFVMGTDYRLGLFALHCLFMLACLLAPLGLAVALAPGSMLSWFALAAYFAPALIHRIGGARRIGIPDAALAGIALGYAIVVYGMFRSLFGCLRHRGVYWRGQIYPLDELRANQRFKMSPFG